MVPIIGRTRGTGLLIARQLARRDVPARVLARDPRASRATFEIVWGPGRCQLPWPGLLECLQPDSGDTDPAPRFA